MCTKRLRISCLLVCWWSVHTNSETARTVSIAEIEATQTKIFNLIEDGIGPTAFQEYVTGLEYDAAQVIELDDAISIAGRISSKLQGRETRLKELRDTIVQHYGDVHSNRDGLQECRSIELHETSPLHNTELNRDTWCVAGTELANDGPHQFLPTEVLQKMKDIVNSDRTAIKGVSFGSEAGGILTKYPASRLCQTAPCDRQYDPRFEARYVTAATPQPKDIVIIMDKSGSMSQTIDGDESLISIARKAGITVLKTLNPNDRVGVVVFNEEAFTFTGTVDTSTCYENTLAKATPQNIKLLTQFLSHTTPGGETKYSSALQKAFQLFSNTGIDLDEHRHQVILMLTDGDPEDDDLVDIYQVLRDGNAALANRVVVLTYGIGELTSHGEQILRNISDQVSANASAGEVHEGEFQRVTTRSADNLRRAMGSYYDFFKESLHWTQIQYTVPYPDAFGTGLQVSMCLQVIVNHHLEGVTCLDQPLEDIVSEITYYRKGHLSYGFIMDEQQRVMTHPLLPNPSDVDADVSFTHITTLESGGEIDQVIDRMVRGEAGSVISTSKRIRARGDVQKEGVSSTSVQSNYFFAPIEHTKFSLCLVNTHNATFSSISSNNWSGGYPPFLYHKYVDEDENREIGRAATRVAVCDKGTIKLAARAFTDQQQYLVQSETVNDLNMFKQYFSGQLDLHTFQPSVRETAAMVAHLNRIYGERTAYADNIIWRYFGTDAGVHFTYPGIELHKLYDPTGRTWYQRALAYPNKLIITTPYEDAFGAGTVLSWNRVIYGDSPANTRRGSTDSLIIGVMGLDVSLSYTYHLITDGVAACASNVCFLVDLAGFIVAHKQWIGDPDVLVEEVHFTYYEEKIAAELQRENIWIHAGQSCVNIEDVREQQYGKIDLTGSFIRDWFEIHEIVGTNIFLVVKKGVTSLPGSCDCPIRRGNPFSVEICSPQTQCTCPCREKTELYQYCAGEFHIGSDDPPPCAPPVPFIDWDDIAIRDALQLPDLPYCHNYGCQDKQTMVECTNTLTCAWCIGRALGQCDARRVPSCRDDTDCAADQTAFEEASCAPPTPEGSRSPGALTDEKDGLPAWAIALIVIAVILLAVTIILAVLLYLRHRQPTTEHTNDQDPYARISHLSHIRPTQRETNIDEQPPKPAGHQPAQNRYGAPPSAHSVAADSGIYLTTPAHMPDVACDALNGNGSADEAPPVPRAAVFVEYPPRPCPAMNVTGVAMQPPQHIVYEVPIQHPRNVIIDPYAVN